MRRAALALALVAGAVMALSLAGCASAPSPAQSALTGPAGPSVKMSSAQAAELADGKVTLDEYTAAMRRYVACDAKAGYVVQVGQLVDNVYEMAIPAAARDSGVDLKCDQREYFFLDQKWQIAHQDTTAVAIATGKCIAAKGITPATHWLKRYAQAMKLGINPAKCIAKYPEDVPTFAPTP